jgi:histidinol-phosphate aminotransferase
MYAVCAELQGARLATVALRDGDEDFHVDLAAVADVALAQGAKLVFLCSPGNPAGGVLAPEAVFALARQLEGRALVVVDEAYIEFADQPSLLTRSGRPWNLAVLRTLSKAHALAAARIGCLIAHVEVIDALRRCQAPYPVPRPCADLALRALEPAARLYTDAGVAGTCRERERMCVALDGMAGVRRVYPSQANFLLVRFDQAESAYRTLLEAGIVVRDMRALPQLADALRISIGMPAQNTRVIAALQSLADAA